MCEEKQIARELFDKFHKEISCGDELCSNCKAKTKKIVNLCIEEIILTHQHSNIIALGGYNSQNVVKLCQILKQEVSLI